MLTLRKCCTRSCVRLFCSKYHRKEMLTNECSAHQLIRFLERQRTIRQTKQALDVHPATRQFMQILLHRRDDMPVDSPERYGARHDLPTQTQNRCASDKPYQRQASTVLRERRVLLIDANGVTRDSWTLGDQRCWCWSDSDSFLVIRLLVGFTAETQVTAESDRPGVESQ